MIYRYILEDILNDKKLYKETKEEVENIIFTNIDNRNIEIIVVIEDDEYAMTFGNFLTFLITFRVFVDTKCEFDGSFIYDPSDTDNINDYFDSVLNYTLYNLDEEDFEEVNNTIVEIIAELADVSGIINGAYGSTISIKSMIELGKKNKEFHDLIHLKLPNDNLEFIEVESFIKESLNKSINILENEPNNLQNFIKSGAGINTKQLGQVINMVGSKPDLDGVIIPYPITSSFLRGLDLPSYFIVSKGARKAQLGSVA